MNTGGPAYPTHPVMGQISAPCLGMTLRDYFAAKAMQGLLTSDIDAPIDVFAIKAYVMADAMLREREA